MKTYLVLNWRLLGPAMKLVQYMLIVEEGDSSWKMKRVYANISFSSLQINWILYGSRQVSVREKERERRVGFHVAFRLISWNPAFTDTSFNRVFCATVQMLIALIQNNLYYGLAVLYVPSSHV